MTYNELFEQVKNKKSFLCVGLDSDIKKLPQHLMGAEDPVYEFNKAIVDATADVAIAYKPNIAFYESNGVSGWITMLNAGTLEIHPRCTPVLSWRLWNLILSRWLLIWERIP